MKLKEAREFTIRKIAEGHKSDGCTFVPEFWVADACKVHDMLLRFRPIPTGEIKKITPYKCDWIFFLLLLRRGFILAPIYYAAVSLRTMVLN